MSYAVLVKVSKEKQQQQQPLGAIMVIEFLSSVKNTGFFFPA